MSAPNDKSTSNLKELGLNPKNIPQHIAIIMDGNGRWAKGRFLPRQAGHREGAEALRRTIKACVEFGIRYLTVYVFSTENWKRPKTEVNFLMGLFKKLIVQEFDELDREGVYIKCLGDINKLHPEILKLIEQTEEKTRKNKTLQLNLMINYGSQDEIVQACRKILLEGSVNPDSLDPELFSKYLFTADITDPDILIRTGGDFRLSNFLLWQTAYAELFFPDILWPDFNREVLLGILTSFQKRERRFGGLQS
ncbi:polyprenyl diphosphate synthase [Candidatus Margulisiibacteriota bacterium]